MRRKWGKAFRTVAVLAGAAALAAVDTQGQVPAMGAIRGVIDIREYGVRGDDSTDNQAALTKAIALLPPSGGAIYLPPGVYRHSGTLAWPNKNFVVFGAGDLSSTLKSTGNGPAHTLASDGSTFTNVFRDLAVVATASTGAILDFGRPGRLTMENVRIRAEGGHGSTGLKIHGDTLAAQQTTLINVYINGNFIMTTGLHLSGRSLPGVTATTIIGGRINQTASGVGMKLETVQGAHVYGMNIEGNAVGVEIDGGRVISLNGVWFESNTVADVRIKATSISSVGVTVRDSTFATAGTVPYNIDLQAPGRGKVASRGHRIISNHFGSAPVSGHVRIQAGVRGTMIAFNSFAQAPAVVDSGSATVQWVNLLANDTVEAAIPSSAFTSLSVLPNGSLLYCTDCKATDPCASGGTGAIAKRVNDVWVCR